MELAKPKVARIVLTSSKNEGYCNEEVIFKAVVYDQFGKPMQNVKVAFYRLIPKDPSKPINEDNIERIELGKSKTDSNGVAELRVAFGSEDKYTIQAENIATFTERLKQIKNVLLRVIVVVSEIVEVVIH